MNRREWIWLSLLALVAVVALLAGLYVDRDTKKKLLLEVAGNGRVKETRELLERGAPINGRSGGHECTALYAAAGRGQTAVVALLLEQGADPNIPCGDPNNAWDSRDKTPLHVARNVEIAQLLIEHGTQLDTRDGESFTPVHRAIERGNVALVRLLVEQGAILPREWDRAEDAPLLLALNYANQEMVAFLLQNGFEWSEVVDTLKLAIATSPEILPFLESAGLDPAIVAEWANEAPREAPETP